MTCPRSLTSRRGTQADREHPRVRRNPWRCLLLFGGSYDLNRVGQLVRLEHSDGDPVDCE